LASTNFGEWIKSFLFLILARTYFGESPIFLILARTYSGESAIFLILAGTYIGETRIKRSGKYVLRNTKWYVMFWEIL